MIILSYNSRGLGRGVKWTAVRRLIAKHKVDIVCLQETKRETFSKNICQAIWGDSSAQWDYVPSVQAAGGLLCIWNNSIFEAEGVGVSAGEAKGVAGRSGDGAGGAAVEVGPEGAGEEA